MKDVKIQDLLKEIEDLKNQLAAMKNEWAEIDLSKFPTRFTNRWGHTYILESEIRPPE